MRGEAGPAWSPSLPPLPPEVTTGHKGEYTCDDDIPPAPVFDSIALVDDDEATESDSHQPEHEAAQEPGLSRSAVEEFIIFEYSCWPATG